MWPNPYKFLCAVAIVAALSGCDTGAAPTSNSPAATSPPKAQTVLLDQQGTGTATSAKFSAAGDWDLNYTYDCSAFGSSGNFQVFLYGKDSSDIKGIPVNELGKSGASVTHEHDAGTFFLKMNSECAWHVTVKG